MTQMQTCHITGKSFEITEPEIAFCDGLGVLLPDISPEERIRQLMAFRNEWKLYRRKCDSTKKEIISAYAPDAPFLVYENSMWWGDSWDALEYGRDFDFNRPFFEQFAELQKRVPREGTSIFNCENCDYNSHLRQSRNCYLNALGIKSEDCLYTYWTVENKDVMDSIFINYSTLCYEGRHLNYCYNGVMLEECNNCTDCYFSYQLRGCDHCLFCSNLANKSYYLWNKPCTKEEFETAKNKILCGSWRAWLQAKEQFEAMKQQAVRRFTYLLKCENSTGDHLLSCKNCFDTFEGLNGEDCYHLTSFGNCKDVHNVYSAGWEPCEEIYYSAVVRGSQNLAFCNYIWFSNNLRYCDSCVSCENCFGCIGLKHKKFCILNKQYTKEKYEKLVQRIIEHMKNPRGHGPSAQASEVGSRGPQPNEAELKNKEWGSFFPPTLSPFAYNETPAQVFLPLEKEEILKRGWRWRDQDIREYQPATLKEIPDLLSDIRDDITKKILACEDCLKNYRIVAQELKFYRLMNLPIPRLCPECRNKNRIQADNPRKLFQRQCSKCGKDISSPYTSNRPEIVYCEKCYLESVY